MRVISLIFGHNSSAALLEDGVIKGCVSEERFDRIKNSHNFPINAINYLLKDAGLENNYDSVDLYVHAAHTVPNIHDQYRDYQKAPLIDMFGNIADTLYYKLPFLRKIITAINDHLLVHSWMSKKSIEKVKDHILKFIPVDREKIILADHHTCHAYSVYYGFVPNKLRKENWLVFTLDGEGDGVCASVSTVKNGKWQTVAKTKRGSSIAGFYGAITGYLGMKIDEHEYKVMGLAPYGSSYYSEKVLKEFEGLYKVNDDLTFSSVGGFRFMRQFLARELKHTRFDGVAAAAQQYVEDIVCEWVSKAVAKTGVANVALVGGFFMNVKANKRVMEVNGLKNVVIAPSAGDESAPFGAAYYGAEKLGLDIANESYAMENIYLGPEFTDAEIEKAIKDTEADKKYRVYKPAVIEEEIADLLSKDKIVSRFNGRMEFGARALGNRSILANPSHTGSVRVINEQIKSRDFWMPFACSVLKDRENDYIKNPKNIEASFMILTFDSKELAQKELIAGMHPYDFTIRPQLVTEIMNPSYYKIIKAFEKKTGIGGVLNTSFNLHGEPVVCSPLDAISTFERSGLQYLAAGSYIITKEK